jgi:hypothetical protein
MMSCGEDDQKVVGLGKGGEECRTIELRGALNDQLFGRVTDANLGWLKSDLGRSSTDAERE